jgi:uncharacterized membrane protein YoaK (UPF0700 family)
MVTKDLDHRGVPLAVPALLSFVAGYVDSCTFLGLFGVFVAHVTGSFVIAGAQLVTHDDHLLIKVLAIPVFFAAAMLTTAVVAATDGWRYGALPWALVLEELLLAGFAGVGIAGSPFPDVNAPLALAAALLGLSAMGVQSAFVRLLMPSFGSTNVMTNNTTQLAINLTKAMLAWRKRHRMPGDSATTAELAATRQQLFKVLVLVLGFLLGTLAGAIAYVRTGLWCVLTAMLLVAGLIVWSLLSKRGRVAPNPDPEQS